MRYYFGNRDIASLNAELDAWLREVDGMRPVEAAVSREKMQAIRDELHGQALDDDYVRTHLPHLVD